MSDNGGSGGGPGAGKGSFGQSMKAVFWAFFGVRKRRDLESDATQLNPLHVLAAALIGAAIFIGILILVVHAVVR
jgi:amino acid transporter